MENVTQQRKNLIREFTKTYGDPLRLFRAPGRVNLIGEHTDYNGGFCLPFAIDRDTAVAARIRDDRKVRVTSLDIGESALIDPAEPEVRGRGTWLDHIEGIIRSLGAEHDLKHGADLIISSSVPIGGGLSSSAALQMSVGYTLLRLNGIEIDGRRLALAGQQAEHEFVGTRSGIMDQFTSVFGREGHALLLDCRSITAKAVPLDLPGYSLVVCDTRVKHTLAAGEYNSRRAECEMGVRLLQEWLPGITSLRDVSPAAMKRYGEKLPAMIRRRCEHVVEENERTLQTAESLKAGDLAAVGRYLFESHRSLRDKYEVSSPELDLLVVLAGSVEGVMGARMTGGGFGGCTINLVADGSLGSFRHSVSEKYEVEFGTPPDIFPVLPSSGASEIDHAAECAG